MTFSDLADLSDVRAKINRAIDRVVDVRDFGAVSGEDCTSAFVAALLVDGGAIYVPHGIYYTSAIQIERPVKIFGSGAASIIKSTGINKSIFYGNAITDIYFDNLSIHGNQTGLGGLGENGGNGISLTNANNVKVTNCNFDYFGKTPEGTSSHACPISITGEKVFISQCFFGENCYNVTGADIGVGVTTDAIITNNISHSECDAFASISAVSNQSGTNVVRHVVSGNIAKRKAGSRCRSAILTYYDAQPGYVSISGNYIEGFSWCAIYGSGGVAPTTDQDAGGVSISGNTIRYCGGGGTISAAIYVAGQAGGTVSGNFIRDTGYNSDGTERTYPQPAIGLLQYTKSVSITGNTIKNSSGAGVQLSSFAGGIENCSVVGNVIEETHGAPIIVASQAAGVQCRNINLSGNSILHSTDVSGIFIERTNSGENRNINISSNIIECTNENPSFYGVHFRNSGDGGAVCNNVIIGYSIGINFSAGSDRDIPSIMRVAENFIKNCSLGFSAGGKIAIEFGNTYQSVTTPLAFRAHSGRPIGDDGSGNLLVEYVDVPSGPFQGNWFRGDRIISDEPFVDANGMVFLGKVCVSSGTYASSTWATQYISTVSPAT